MPSIDPKCLYGANDIDDIEEIDEFKFNVSILHTLSTYYLIYLLLLDIKKIDPLAQPATKAKPNSFGAQQIQFTIFNSAIT